ncbi:MAG: hypothetical protein V4732_22100 [Pseudomonadota bacterium]
MSESTITNEGTRLPNLSLANLSLGAAFALSAILPTTGIILSTLGLNSGLKILQNYQLLIFLAFANYWLPAIFIYSTLRLSKISACLRLSTSVHLTILIGNLLFILYIVARTLASTVQGGGVSFAVALYRPLIIFPA